MITTAKLDEIFNLMHHNFSAYALIVFIESKRHSIWHGAFIVPHKEEGSMYLNIFRDGTDRHVHFLTYIWRDKSLQIRRKIRLDICEDVSEIRNQQIPN